MITTTFVLIDIKYIALIFLFNSLFCYKTPTMTLLWTSLKAECKHSQQSISDPLLKKYFNMEEKKTLQNCIVRWLPTASVVCDLTKFIRVPSIFISFMHQTNEIWYSRLSFATAFQGTVEKLRRYTFKDA